MAILYRLSGNCFDRLKKRKLEKPYQRENTGVINLLSETREITSLFPTFSILIHFPFLNYLHISPFFSIIHTFFPLF
ncbi:hypothetical protein KSU1_C0299 [Candidatus Jettenia caeni]|uniref:Uncharacterized protein n=1 Tax=Candidatus Jettenia caeni TaxID=247490 RepID=I3IJK0_9BACT|nr:hypothetical protein KSU1_C0299 [Candidatus Jettenia caeni]